MASYRVAAPAVRDLDEIWDYYDRMASEDVADGQLARLRERFRLLGENPYIGVARPEFAPAMRSHTAPDSRYIIFYFPRTYGVEIARIIHGSRDLLRLFG